MSSVIRYYGGSQPQKPTTSTVKFHKTKEKPINQNEVEAGRASAPVLATPPTQVTVSTQTNLTLPEHFQSP